MVGVQKMIYPHSSLLWSKTRVDAPLCLVAHGPAILGIHGLHFPLSDNVPGSSARRLEPVGRTYAPARSAPELSQVRQDRPRPSGRTPGPLPRVSDLVVSMGNRPTSDAETSD